MGRTPYDDDGDYSYCIRLLKQHNLDYERQDVPDCDQCPVQGYCEIKKISERTERMKADEAKGFTENEAFLVCMLPMEGPITRAEFEKVKRAVGRLWMGFWNLRRMYTISDEEWAESVRKTIEEYGGGLDTYKRKREAMEKAKKTLPEEKVKEVISSVRSFFRSLPFSPTLTIPQDCETVLDLLEYYKYPLEQIVVYILPTLGFQYVERIKNPNYCQTNDTKIIESLTGED